MEPNCKKHADKKIARFHDYVQTNRVHGHHDFDFDAMVRRLQVIAFSAV